MGRHFDKNEPTDTLVIVGSRYASWLSILEEEGWQCFCCLDLRDAQNVFSDIGPCIGILDLTKDDFSLNAIANLAYANKQVRWIAVVASEQMENDAVCQLISNFCVDYFTAPVPDEQLRKTIGHQRGMLKLEQHIWPELVEHPDFGLIGESPAMIYLRDQIARAAPTELPILIKGESGTGKELIARAIHSSSNQVNGQMVTLNCSVINDDNEQYKTVFDEEEFQSGRLAVANNGTLFLNEVGELPLAYQSKLMDYFLRNNPEYRQRYDLPKSNIRIIAGTHIDLEQAVSEGKFREDLFYRLNVLPVQVASLSERGKDIVLLAEYFLFKFASEYNTQARAFTDEAKEMLMCYSWPGNVRELINQIKRAVLLADSLMIEPKHLDLPHQADMKQSLRRVREESEREALMGVLDSCGGQVTAAAKELGVSRATMYRLLNKHDLISSNRKYNKQF